MNFSDTLSLSLRSLRSNKLRTAITVSIIAFGIMALIGIITAIGAMSQKLNESFSTMGAHGFTLRFKERNVQFGPKEKKIEVEQSNIRRKDRASHLNKTITPTEAEAFKKQYRFPSVVSISTFAGSRNSVFFYRKKTNPNVSMIGGDEKFAELNGFEMSAGRNFTPQEISAAAHVCLLGADVASRLSSENPSFLLNKIVRVNNVNCRVVGILASRGSSFGFTRDNLIILNYKTLSRYFNESSYSIGVRVDDPKHAEEAMGEAEGIFRQIRKMSVADENNFVLDRSNSMAEKAIKSLRLLTFSVTVIGLITLIGAAIGLMNILLVAVAERTKEIGVIKAIGGKSKNIHHQFLTEAVLICLLGAVLGIILGVAVGNIFAVLLQTSVIIPWVWVMYGIVICTTVGLVAGLYPAIRAGKLNPIEALRYE